MSEAMKLGLEDLRRQYRLVYKAASLLSIDGLTIAEVEDVNTIADVLSDIADRLEEDGSVTLEGD